MKENINIEEFISRIDRLMADYSASITKENTEFVEGVLYGLNLAIAYVKCLMK